MYIRNVTADKPKMNTSNGTLVTPQYGMFIRTIMLQGEVSLFDEIDFVVVADDDSILSNDIGGFSLTLFVNKIIDVDIDLRRVLVVS
jgi:hypothetical protein